MKNIFLKYFVLMAVFLFISGCMEEKEVQGPIPYTPTKATQINKNDPNTFYGAYLVSNFEPKNNNIVGLDNFTGGFFISYDALSNQLQYKYALKYGGYDNQYTSAKLAYSNEFQTIPDYEIAEDNYTIILNEGEDALDINYDLEDEYASLIIYNNYGLLLSNKEVIIRVISSDEKSESLYHLNVITESDETVSNMNEQIALEIKKTTKVHIESIIASISFLCILLVLGKLFKKSSNKIY